MTSSFEWDPAKDAANQLKHGVSFTEAQFAFLDASRVIAKDVTHSKTEERWYCFGKVEDRIMTVRFTYRDQVIRILGAGYWTKGRKVYETQTTIHK
jgi:uncharacterized DUF497 family protein